MDVTGHRVKVWEYQDPKRQTTCFRGYVLAYTDSPKVYRYTCPEVRQSKLQAKKDAEKLIKTLKNETNRILKRYD